MKQPQVAHATRSNNDVQSATGRQAEVRDKLVLALHTLSLEGMRIIHRASEHLGKLAQSSSLPTDAFLGDIVDQCRDDAALLVRYADEISRLGTFGPHTDERSELSDEFIMSDEFNDLVTGSFREATRMAVAEHLAAGRSVHGNIGGTAVEISPLHAGGSRQNEG